MLLCAPYLIIKSCWKFDLYRKCPRYSSFSNSSIELIFSSFVRRWNLNMEFSLTEILLIAFLIRCKSNSFNFIFIVPNSLDPVVYLVLSVSPFSRFNAVSLRFKVPMVYSKLNSFRISSSVVFLLLGLSSRLLTKILGYIESLKNLSFTAKVFSFLRSVSHSLSLSSFLSSLRYRSSLSLWK